MIISILAIAFLSTIVWGHHMFVTGMNPFLGSVFTFTTLLIAIPSAVKAFNYITTLWKGNIQFNPPMLFAIAFVSTFITGGLTGIILGDSALDINVHDTYFVVAHFHLVMGISALYGMLAGMYHWYPIMFGRMMNKNLGYIHFWITAISAYGVFFPMHFIGMAGLPRRYYTNSNFPLFDDLADTNQVITILPSWVRQYSWFSYIILYTVYFMERKLRKTLGNLQHLNGLHHRNIFTETGREKSLKFIVGHMIIVSLATKKTLCHSTFRSKQTMMYISAKN